MNCLRFWGKKRPREQTEAQNRNVQQQKVEEATGNISKNEAEKALQENDVIELEEYQKLVNAQQTKIVGFEQNQQALQKLIAALSETAKCVESERVEQIKLGLKEETNRKLDELRNNSLDAIEKGMNQLKGELIAKMEKQQQDIVDAFTEAQKGNVEHFSLLRAKIDELERKQKANQKEHRAKIDEEYQNKQQLNIEQKTVVEFNLNPQNRWDFAACHDKLTLIEPDRLIVQHTGGFQLIRSVFAERPIPTNPFGIFYYEVKLFGKGYVYIGLATNQMPLGRCVGEHEGTYAYGSDGCFVGHAIDGYRKSFNGGAKCKFAGGAVVGCGVDLATRQIFYTKNGKRLNTANLFVATDLFPCVTLCCSGDKIEANFGPDFKYKF